jgi:hypothetical protein
MHVSITGGGAGDKSYCTTDETVTSFITKGNDEAHHFGFDSKGSGICALNTSYSYFKVSVKDASGKSIGDGDMWFGQSALYGPYHVTCGPEGSFGGIDCAVTSDRVSGRDLKITRSTNAIGKPNTGDHRVQAGATFDVGSGYDVRVIGGGDGTSNCTTDETAVRFPDTQAGDHILYGFVAKDGGSCRVEFSWSNFKVELRDPKEHDRVIGSGRMWLGQLDPWIGYRASCESGDPNWHPSGPGPRPYVWDRLKCVQTGAYEVKITRP